MLILSLVSALVAQGATAPCTANPTIATNVVRWAPEPNTTVTPPEAYAIVFRQHAEGPSNIAGGADLQAVTVAFDRWMAVTCPSGAFPNVFAVDGYFVYGEDYPTRDGGEVFDGNGQLVASDSVVFWVEDAQDWWADALSVAMTSHLAFTETGFIFTADIELNGFDYAWRTVDPETSAPLGCSAASASCFDIETVLLREAGYFLGLGAMACTDAALYPDRPASTALQALSTHDRASLCAMYPPRAAVGTKRDFGELCAATSECAGSSNTCLKPEGMGATDPVGWCTMTCTASAGCPAGFTCRQAGGSAATYCLPGSSEDSGGTGTGGSGGTGNTGGGTGGTLASCAVCSRGSDCTSGLCIADGFGGTLCSQRCRSSADCPTKFYCGEVDGLGPVCLPESRLTCSDVATPGGQNELCYLAGPGGPTTDYARSCETGLSCFGFQPRCGGQEGACVRECTATKACPALDNVCCYGLGSNGECLEASAGISRGGCFDQRRVGETCVTAERSVCESGASCLNFGNKAGSLCYAKCTRDDECGSNGTCRQFADSCGVPVSVCCDITALGTTGTCAPQPPDHYEDLGLPCAADVDCDAGLCLAQGSERRCSLECDPFDAAACPGGDFLSADVELACIGIGGKNHCWPRPLENLKRKSDDGGCSQAMPTGLAALLAVAGIVRRLRSRRSTAAT